MLSKILIFIKEENLPLSHFMTNLKTLFRKKGAGFLGNKGIKFQVDGTMYNVNSWDKSGSQRNFING